MDGKLGVAIIPKGFMAEECVLLFSFGDLTLSPVCL